ncbi:hypothetical protein EDB83DRAFT_1462176 [Lactarius deliciosus]|nr:hypothetical protein EDB83DRAFT_1462176 [Lactarius deliciosus]
MSLLWFPLLLPLILINRSRQMDKGHTLSVLVAESLSSELRTLLCIQRLIVLYNSCCTLVPQPRNSDRDSDCRHCFSSQPSLNFPRSCIPSHSPESRDALLLYIQYIHTVLFLGYT